MIDIRWELAGMNGTISGLLNFDTLQYRPKNLKSDFFLFDYLNEEFRRTIDYYEYFVKEDLND